MKGQRDSDDSAPADASAPDRLREHADGKMVTGKRASPAKRRSSAGDGFASANEVPPGDRSRTRNRPSTGERSGSEDGSGSAERAGPEDRSSLGQILAQQAAVAAIGQRALGERSIERLFSEAVDLVADILVTEFVSVLELSADGSSLLLVAGRGWRDGVVGNLVLGAQSGSMAGFTLATGAPVIVDDLDEETRFSVSDVLREAHVRSGMSVRIGEPDSPWGALAAFTRERGHFTVDDANFLQSVANVLAAAIARAHVESELRRSRDELAAIVASVTDGITVQRRDGRLVFANDAAARLTGYATAAELVDAPIAEVMARFELLEPDGRAMPLTMLPSRRALAGEVVAPRLVRFRIRSTGEERWSIVQASPVRSDGGEVAQVVNVFRDVTDEQRAEDWRRFVADTLAAVTATLNPAEAAHRLAQACVPFLAEYAIVDLLEQETITRAAIVHADPGRRAAVQRLRSVRPVSFSDATGPARVIRDGTPEVVELTPELLAGAARNDEERTLLLGLGLRCYLSVPLMARNRPIGALTLITAESGRSFAEHDLRQVAELGARAGVALENARLYEAVNERRDELDAVLSAMAEAVLVFDARGRRRLANRAAEETFERAVPPTLTDLARALRPADRPDAPPTDDLGELGAEVRLPGSGRSFELRRYRSERTAADRPGTVRPTVVVLRDVSDTRYARAARDAFMGVLSHELRTPITTIYGGSLMLERDLDDERRRDVVRDIRSEADRLARLIEDLLVMTRVERGGVEVGDEPVLVQRILPALAEALSTRMPGLRVELEIGEALPAVRGDATYLEQVLRNLMTNAVRYGNALESGLVVRAEEDGGEVVVRVQDAGPGLPDDDTERLFELFYRAPSARAVPGGAGIGLFVCRHLVEAMGGRMWARNRPNGGAEFGFALPIIEADVG